VRHRITIPYIHNLACAQSLTITKRKKGEKKMSALREIRMKKGLNMCELARLGGINHSQLSLYETGVNRPSYATASKFSKVLGVPVEKLFPGLTLRGAPRAEKAVNHE
jgi:transcriptional regulator with XRE-family HTH domain